jgi:hypothetical protein
VAAAHLPSTLGPAPPNARPSLARGPTSSLGPPPSFLRGQPAHSPARVSLPLIGGPHLAAPFYPSPSFLPRITGRARGSEISGEPSTPGPHVEGSRRPTNRTPTPAPSSLHLVAAAQALTPLPLLAPPHRDQLRRGPAVLLRFRPPELPRKPRLVPKIDSESPDLGLHLWACRNLARTLSQVSSPPWQLAAAGAAPARLTPPMASQGLHTPTRGAQEPGAGRIDLVPDLRPCAAAGLRRRRPARLPCSDPSLGEQHIIPRTLLR